MVEEVQVCFEAVYQEACKTAAAVVAGAVAALVAVVVFDEAKQAQAAGCVHQRCSHSSQAQEQKSPHFVGSETGKMNLYAQLEASLGLSEYQPTLVCL